MKVKSLSRNQLLATPWTAAYQAPPSMEFSRQEYWSGVPLRSPHVQLGGLKFSFGYMGEQMKEEDQLPGQHLTNSAILGKHLGVSKSRTRLSDFPFTFHFHALEKKMATHSSVLAWRIPGTGEPGGLLSTGSHRVGRY